MNPRHAIERHVDPSGPIEPDRRADAAQHHDLARPQAAERRCLGRTGQPCQCLERAAEKVAIPESLKTPEFLAAWADWCQYHRLRRCKRYPSEAVAELKRCAAMGPKQAAATVLKSIRSGAIAVSASAT